LFDREGPKDLVLEIGRFATGYGVIGALQAAIVLAGPPI
jgi:hypothetical protein